MSSKNKSKAQRRLLALGAAIGASAAAAFFLHRVYQQSMERSKTEEAQRLIEALGQDPDATIQQVVKEYACGIFDSLYDLAQTAARVRENFEQRNLANLISAQDFNSLLLTDELKATLEAVLDDILKKHDINMSVDAFRSISDDRSLLVPEVAKFKEGVAKMFTDACAGLIPLIPGLPLPLGITASDTLSLLDTILRQKRLALDQVFRDSELMKGSVLDPTMGFIPTDEASAKILAVANQAEYDVLEKTRKIHLQDNLNAGLNDVGAEQMIIAFKSLIGFYCREEGSDFYEKRANLTQRHTHQIMALIKRAVEDGDDSIPLAMRSHPIVKRFGGSDAIRYATTVTVPSSESIVYNATQDDLLNTLNENHRVIIVVKANSPKASEPQEGQENSQHGALSAMSFEEKLNNLLLTEALSVVEHQGIAGARLKFLVMCRDEIEKVNDIPEVQVRFTQLGRALTGTEGLIDEALPLALVCPDTVSGCSFATRDIGEAIRRIKLLVSSTDHGQVSDLSASTPATPMLTPVDKSRSAEDQILLIDTADTPLVKEFNEDSFATSVKQDEEREDNDISIIRIDPAVPDLEVK